MRGFLLSAVLLASLPLEGAGDKIQDKQEQLFATIDHLQVEFSQTTYKKIRDRSVTRSGVAFFSKPNMFRWNFTSDPSGVEEYYFNGEKLSHYREKEKIVNNFARAGQAQELKEVVNLVLDPKALFSRYKLKDTKTTSGMTDVILSPISKDTTDVDSIFIKVSDSRKSVEEVQIFYIDGNNTKFTFKNPKFQANDSKIFTFPSNKNVTVRNHG